MKKNILIVGANFTNKGAQSMLFVTIDEIKKRIKDCEIYFADTTLFDKEYYAFRQLYYSGDAEIIALKDSRYFPIYFKCVIKDTIRFLAGKHNNLWRFLDAGKLAPFIDLMIDISGFSLGDRWKEGTNQFYLNHIRLARKYKIPIYLMPQSFGPFNYPPELAYIRNEIKDLMSYPKLVFAREKEGYELLCSEFALKNIRRSTDLVLQNNGINIENIYQKKVELNIPSINSVHAVGIVPNKQCFNRGDKERISEIYFAIISELLQQNKKIYILAHSKQDKEICRIIADMFTSNAHVYLLTNDFTCLEYDDLVKKFEFIVCSRYHGIVHAYRNYIPCVTLGWAVKYKELAECVGQLDYEFDITQEDCTKENIIEAIRKLIKRLPYEKAVLKQKVEEIQKNNCFDYISELGE